LNSAFILCLKFLHETTLSIFYEAHLRSLRKIKRTVSVQITATYYRPTERMTRARLAFPARKRKI
ncbi:MAG: hypothetical protein LIO96_12785, partial [Lachnospiraceae bacterium]|nr:hypothetical protein [Lachnospiraceae bacterium]